MNRRHDEVMTEIQRFSVEERRERVAAVRAEAPAETNAYIDALAKKKKDKGKSFPTYRNSDRRKTSDRAATGDTYTWYLASDVRSRSVVRPPSPSNASQAHTER